MLVRFSSVSLAVAVAAMIAASAAFAASMVTPAKGGFSIEFPAPPEEKSLDEKSGAPVTGKVWSVRDKDVLFFTDYVDYSHAVDAEGEMRANAKNFAGTFQGKLTSSKPRKFKRPSGATLSGIEFTFDAPTVAGAGLSVVDGRRSYVAAAVSIKPYDGSAEIERFLKSFQLTKR
jgi:hypothetical protein